MHFPSVILIFRHASTATRVTQKPSKLIIPEKTVSSRTPLYIVHHYKSLPISYREARKKSYLNVRNVWLRLYLKWNSCPRAPSISIYGQLGAFWQYDRTPHPKLFKALGAKWFLVNNVDQYTAVFSLDIYKINLPLIIAIQFIDAVRFYILLID